MATGGLQAAGRFSRCFGCFLLFRELHVGNPGNGERKSVRILGAIELWRMRFDYPEDTVNV